MRTKAIVLLSGGIDSTVVLALALAANKQCFALSFDYQQRHLVELEAAKKIARHYGVDHRIIKIDPVSFGKSSLINKTNLPENRSFQQMSNEGIPNTYVPARNTLFLAYALGLCEILEAQEIHFGANALDASGYPDCRPAFIQAYQNLINVATKQAVEENPPRLVTPLVELNKVEIVKVGMNLKAPLELTSSCYQPLDLTHPCLKCDACLIREDALKKAFTS